MTIAAIGAAVSAASSALPALPTTPTGATGALDALGQAGAAGQAGGGFQGMVGNAIDNIVGTQAKADNLAVQAATGQLTDVHDYMIAATEANLTTELTVAVRNKAVEAFNDIMRMQV